MASRGGRAPPAAQDQQVPHSLKWGDLPLETHSLAQSGRNKKCRLYVPASACSGSLGVDSPSRGVEQLSKAPRFRDTVWFEDKVPPRATLRLGYAV